ncbi:hypothetical protein JCM8547_008155 [Rhodosporidiobolus lusitaniae]
MDAPPTLPVLVSLYHPFPRTLSLSLPSSAPLSSIISLLPASLSSSTNASNTLLTYSTGLSLPSSSSPLSSLTGARRDEGGFVTLRASVRVRGGKGGFASQLRAQGGRMSSNKAQNTDSCRGLDGRRLSTIKEAQKIAKLLESEPDRLAAAAQQKQAKLDELNAEIARLERVAGVEAAPVASGSGSGAMKEGEKGEKAGKVAGGGQNGTKRRLDDQKYVEQSREIVDGVKDAVRAAMLKKRKKNKPASSSAPADSSSTPAAAAAAKENAAPPDAPMKDAKGKGKGKAVEPEGEEEKAEEAVEA